MHLQAIESWCIPPCNDRCLVTSIPSMVACRILPCCCSSPVAGVLGCQCTRDFQENSFQPFLYHTNQNDGLGIIFFKWSRLNWQLQLSESLMSNLHACTSTRDGLWYFLSLEFIITNLTSWELFKRPEISSSPVNQYNTSKSEDGNSLDSSRVSLIARET